MAQHSITHTILDGNLLSDGHPTRAAVERLADATAEAIAEAFPGYAVEVPIQWRTSGAGPRTGTTDYMREHEIRETVHEIAGREWERWCQGLSDADVEK
jgi:hypothetical protein